MKRLIAFVATIAAAAVALVACSGPDNVPLLAKPANALRVATYNVHYIILEEETGAWSVGDWERRKAPLDAAFKTLDADIVAFQEMESFARGDDGNVNLARDYLLERNPAFAAAANGDARVFPSTQPIFYRTDRLEMLDQGWFFFSDTPDVIYSRTFNGSFPAFASWSLFRDGDTTMRVVNVHLEYKSASNRRLSSELIAERIAPWVDAGENVMVIGDLNARAGGVPQQIIGAKGLKFVDVQGSTYHLNYGLNLFGAIDHIGVTDGIMQVGETQVLRQKFLGEWPTDHYPVVADFVVE
ncbi:endonuclease [Yoonia sp. 208BN28-4]|uniref:endonuclease n=1 Tax=Yoonia sp. 208BN28-4 TaxID=3126505 RepID=UPI0030B42798